MKPDLLRIPGGVMLSIPLILFLLLLAAAPAQAQRGRTGGERKTETKEETKPEERRAPESRTEPRREERQPTPRAEPREAPEPRPEPAPETRTPESSREPRNRERREAPGRDERARSDEPRVNGRTTDRAGERGRGGRSAETTRSAERRSAERTTERSGARGTTSRTTHRSADARSGRVVRPASRAAQRAPRGAHHIPKRHYTWHHVPPVPHGGYYYRHAAPVVVLDFDWPWEHRYRRAWSPRYRYRQVVTIDAGYGGRYWDSRLEVRTTYRQRVRHASHREADLDLDIESIELYQDGRYLGRVTRIPDRFSRVRARVHRNGRITFDRDVFVVGSREVGFELIATDRYDGYVLSHWRRGDDFEVAHLDLRRNRVRHVRESRLFDPYGYSGYAPVSVLPEDERWLGDYGPYGVSTYAYDNDYYDDYGFDDRYYYGYGGDSYRSDGAQRYRPDENSLLSLQGDSDDTFTTLGGAEVRIRREAEIQRVE